LGRGGYPLETLNDLKKSEWKNNVWDAECISKKKLINYGVADVWREWTKN